METTGTAETGASWEGRAVGLLDLDAFFASVEMLDHPEWRGRPVIVGGDPDRRGVVSTASYEARRYGVHSAMPSAQARRLCPEAIWTRGNYERYRQVSDLVMDRVLAETPLVEQVSIDEAFFDVTPGRFSREDPVQICARIAARVRELGVTCSIGLSANKTVSKIASERNKPDGITVVFPGMEAGFLAALPVGAMSGVGPATRAALERLGIATLGQLARANVDELRREFGVAGPAMAARAAGLDDSPVASAFAPADVKSVSNERTFEVDLVSADEVRSAVGYISAMCARRLRRKGLRGRTVTLKVAYSYGDTHTARSTGAEAIDDEASVCRAALALLDDLWSEGTPVRLLGVGVSNWDGRPSQPGLFDDVERDLAERDRRRALGEATDMVRERFGDQGVMLGSELKFKGRVSNTAPMHKDLL